MSIHGKNTRVPDRVLEAAKEAGGRVAKIPGEDSCCVRCEFGDACYRVLNTWVSTLDDDAAPRVTAIFRPAAARAGHGNLPAA
jgi:hypothetical protein